MEEKELQALREHYDRSLELVRGWGLTPFEVDFHVCPADRIYEVASYGIPGHFSHWTYGRDFWIQKTQYDHGLSKIYELVINADPAQAFLLDVNSTLENMFVISHVLGHSDFFANNAYFAHTNRNVEHTAAATAERFREYELRHGRRVVESFIDDVLSVKDHINPYIHTRKKPEDYKISFESDEFLDLFPEERDRRQKIERQEDDRRRMHLSIEPEEDLLLYLAENAPYLEDWERDVIMSIREEEYYFLPQYQTKIMNEGWASLVHRLSMHYLDPDVDPGGIEFADMHSRVLNDHPGRVNPYWLGYNIFLRIIEKYGEHTPQEMQQLNFIGSPGWERALEARELDSDETFIRNYVDQELVERLDLFAFAHNAEEGQWEVTETQAEWEAVRDAFVASKTTLSRPKIVVSSTRGTNTLSLEHVWDGRPLQRRYAEQTLKAICRLWGRDVSIATREDEESPVVMSCSPSDLMDL